MKSNCGLRTASRWLAAGMGLATATYIGYAGVAWARYGRPCRHKPGWKADSLLDRLMPDYEVVERHQIRVAAPADITFAAARDMELADSSIVRAIFRAREMVLGAAHKEAPMPRGLIEQTKAMGWGVLAEIPGREIVMGAVTQPWAAEVVFRALPPEEFAAFHEPGFVKIAWTLRADPDGPTHGEARSIHRTETRVMATDARARHKFRAYWSAFCAGIVLIRRIGLRLVKRTAQDRVSAAGSSKERNCWSSRFVRSLATS